MEILQENSQFNKIPGHSLLAHHLTPSLYAELREKKDSSGYSLLNLMASGLKNIDSKIGVYTGSADSYETFAPLLNKIIESYHQARISDSQFKSDWSPLKTHLGLHEEIKGLVLSTRIRLARNLKDFAFSPWISAASRAELTILVEKALQSLQKDFYGDFYRLTKMELKKQQELRTKHILFQDGDRFSDAGGLIRDWPEDRAIYISKDRHFIVWINEEDHLRVIALIKGEQILNCYSLVFSAMEKLNKKLEFAFHEKLGYLTSCPSNIGTGMRASFHIRLTNLSMFYPEFRDWLLDRLHLQLRKVNGEHSPLRVSKKEGWVGDVSNKFRLGFTERELIQSLILGTRILGLIEKFL